MKLCRLIILVFGIGLHQSANCWRMALLALVSRIDRDCIDYLKPGPHRARQRCSGPVCDRSSASRPAKTASSGAASRFDGNGTGRGRAQTVAKQGRNSADGCGEDGLQSFQRDSSGFRIRPPRVTGRREDGGVRWVRAGRGRMTRWIQWKERVGTDRESPGQI